MPSQAKELWELWLGLIKHTQNVSMQKMNVINIFFKILQKYYKLPILGSLEMFGNLHQKW